MNKILIILCLVFAIAGCKPAVVTPADMSRIEAQSLASNPGLSRYAYPWMYVGSDHEFDYVMYSGVIGVQKVYRVQRGELTLEKRFEQTKDHSAWFPIATNGSMRHSNDFKMENH